MNKSGFWIALGIGAAVGSAFALLYAPQTGDKTRKQLRRGLEDAGEALEEAGEYLKKQADRLSHEADKFLDNGKDQLETVLDSAQGYVKTARKAASKLV